MSETSTRSTGNVGIAFHRPWAFWTGTLAMVGGVMAHLPMFVHSRHADYHMAGIPMTALEFGGMGCIVAGLAVAAWGLFPRRDALAARALEVSHRYHIRSMDDAVLTRAHWALLFVLGVALIIDVMKPATLGFVLPGMSDEYGLPKRQGAYLLLCALTGTVLGSVVWGILADHLGRRASILLASLMFIGTSICGFMPSFGWNLLMCFLMGASAGGMLPIVYALMAESVPARRRGWLVVLHGGMGTVGGTLAAAGSAALLIPIFGWRILWFLGLPTGVVLLVLNRWIPESPRFLLDRGRVDEARSVMARYGVVLEETERPGPNEEELEPEGSRQGNLAALFGSPYVPQTLTVVLYGVAWGLVNWGFIALLPTFLEGAGFSIGAASFLLFLSALLAVPGTVAVAYAYGAWSSRLSMIGFAATTAACLAAFAAINPGAADSRVVIVALTALLFIASGGVIAMLSPYTAEVYPTHLRGTGSGLAAAGSKLGGLLGAVGSTTGLITLTTSLVTPALLVAVPMTVAAVVVACNGVETRGRRLEDIAGRAEGAGAPDERA